MSRPVRTAVALALIAGAALSAAPAFSQSQEDDSRASVTVGPVRVEFAGDGTLTRTVTAFVRGSQPGTVQAELLDAVVREGGYGWTSVRLGSTPNSLQDAVVFTPDHYDFVPNGSEQEFTFTLTVDPAAADHPRFGSFVVTLTPPDPDSGSVAIATAVAIQVVAFGPPTTAGLALELEDLGIVQESAWTTVDRLLPDIPGVIGHGPAVLTATGRNAGEVFLDERTVFEVRRVSPLSVLPWFGGPDPAPILRVTMRPRYLLPGQRFTDSTSTFFQLENGGTVDSLPFIGFVRITATATGTLNSIEAEPASITRTVLVAPWSEMLFVFFVYLVQREWRHRKGRKVNESEEPPPPSLRRRVREVIGRLLRRSGPPPKTWMPREPR
jgi:hypothetical protein